MIAVEEFRTVRDTPLAERYDVVLAHEHVFIDIRCWLDVSHAPTRHLRDVGVDRSTVAAVRTNPFACLDNLMLDDAELMVEELLRLSRHGRCLLIDVTPQNVGRDVQSLAWVARECPTDIVYGCGRYIAESRPEDPPSLPPEAYRDEILAEFAGTRPRPAVIGEIGTGDPIRPQEAASLAGAAMAQAELGAALYVHLHPWGRRGQQALDIVERAGGDLGRVVLCHLDPQIPTGLDYHRELLDRGAMIGFDIWGDEYAYGDVAMPTDDQRLDATAELIADGYGGQLAHSQDVCTKTQLHRFGGAGFDHLPRVVAPGLRARGFTDEEVHRQLAGNAMSLLKMADRNR